MNRLTPTKKKPKDETLGYGEGGRLVRAYLARHPDSTASHIEIATGLPIATINSELTKYEVGSHEEPRYERSGWGLGPLENSKPAVLWRLASEPQFAARRRIRSAMNVVGRVLSEHPQLAGEVVVRAMELAKDAGRREKGENGRKGKK